MKLLSHPHTSTDALFKFGNHLLFSYTCNGCSYLSMLGLKSFHVSIRGPEVSQILFTLVIFVVHLRVKAQSQCVIEEVRFSIVTADL